MRNVEYKKQIFQIRNQFFPFLLSEVKKWKTTDSDIRFTTANDEDRFLAKWLQNRKFSVESEKVFEKGREIHQYFFENLNQIRNKKFEIASWDIGWWQIRNSLRDVYLGETLFEEIKILHNVLKNKLLPQIYSYGFIK